MISLIIICILVIIIIYLVISRRPVSSNNKVKNECDNGKIYTFEGKLKDYIFTYYEKMFFEQLKLIAKDYNCYIFPKMRIADIIETYDKSNLKKIDCKHIDYTICNKSCKPILFIELDDYTHNYKSVKKRDEKKDFIFGNVGKKIIRVTKYNRDRTLYDINKLLKEIQTQ